MPALRKIDMFTIIVGDVSVVLAKNTVGIIIQSSSSSKLVLDAISSENLILLYKYCSEVRKQRRTSIFRDLVHSQL